MESEERAEEETCEVPLPEAEDVMFRDHLEEGDEEMIAMFDSDNENKEFFGFTEEDLG